MHKLLRASNILGGALALVLAGGGAALAAPGALDAGVRLPIVPVANGCGPGAFRTIAGDCHENMRIRGRRGDRAPPPCPRGYLRDPDPARPLCYPAY